MARILRQDAERLMAEVPEEHVFWCCDSRILSNMRELEEAFMFLIGDLEINSSSSHQL